MSQKHVSSAYVTFLGGRQQGKSWLILCRMSHFPPVCTKERAQDDALGTVNTPGARFPSPVAHSKAQGSVERCHFLREGSCLWAGQKRPKTNGVWQKSPDPAQSKLHRPCTAALSCCRSCMWQTEQLTKQQPHEDRQRLPLSPSFHKAQTTLLSPSEVAGAQCVTLKAEN